MNDKVLGDTIESDLRIASGKPVVYVEGKIDIAILFALLGRKASPINPGGSYPCDGTIVRPLQGVNPVERAVEMATARRLSGVYGVTDGDGRSYQDLSIQFDAPWTGPLFRWKAYCIENLLVKTSIPRLWNLNVDWAAELRRYGPYVAINKVIKNLE